MATPVAIEDNAENVDDRPGAGQTINDKYRLEELIGEGSFAWVFRGRHETIESARFAIKVLKPEHCESAATIRRFKREAVTVYGLQNRNTVKIYDFGVGDGGLPYIVMEYVNGISIKELIERHGPLTHAQTARVAIDILRALEEAHGLGIVHRDLKPSNILVSRDLAENRVIAKVLDFGIAKALQGEEGKLNAADATVEGMLFCSPRYAAPEILNGEPSLRSDIYALGHVMAELIAGTPPYTGDSSILVAAQHLKDEPVPLAESITNGPLGAVIRLACSKNLDGRFDNATGMLNAIEAISAQLEAEGDSGSLEAIDLTPAAPDTEFTSDSYQLLRFQESVAAAVHASETQPFEIGSADGAASTGRLINGEQSADTVAGGVPTVDLVDTTTGMSRRTKLLLAAAIAVVAIAAFVLTRNSGTTTDNPAEANNNVATSDRAPSDDNRYAGTPPVAQTGTPDVAGGVDTASAAVREASAVRGAHSLSLYSATPGAMALHDGEVIGALPITNMFVPQERPLRVEVQAEGYTSQTLTFDESGRLNQRVTLEAAPRAERGRRGSRQVRREAPQEEPPHVAARDGAPARVQTPRTERTTPRSDIRNPFEK